MNDSVGARLRCSDEYWEYLLLKQAATLNDNLMKIILIEGAEKTPKQEHNTNNSSPFLNLYNYRSLRLIMQQQMYNVKTTNTTLSIHQQWICLLEMNDGVEILTTVASSSKALLLELVFPKICLKRPEALFVKENFEFLRTEKLSLIYADINECWERETNSKVVNGFDWNWKQF
uniref:Uncharacterized protein n=1 Tax=Glossina pallidipes TaxID=7398 RepID=A0A1A9ZGK8_GLOPL